jgi:hypothetical protein
MSNLTPYRPSFMRRFASIGSVLASIFIPQYRSTPPTSPFEGMTEQARLERPLPPRSQTRWLQSQVEAAVIMADTGDLSMLARLATSLRRDATFAGLLSTRAGGLTRLPKVFRGAPEVVADLESRDDVGLFDRVHSAKELELIDADGIILGVGVGEYLYTEGCDEPTFVRLDPEYLRYRWTEDRWYYQSTAGQLPITPGNGRWVLHMPGGYLQPWRAGLCASLGRAFVAKEHAYLYRENYSGKLAHPARVAVSPQGAPEEHSQSWFRAIMAWGLNSVFGLKPGYDVKLLESNGRGFDVFSQTIDSADREFMIGLAGQIVTVDGGAGFSNSDIHATIRTDLIQGDAMGLAMTVNIQGLRPLINRLYGRKARAWVAWDTRPPVDLAAEANAITAAANAITAANNALKPYGLRVDAVEMTTRFKIPTFPIEISSDRFGSDAPLEDGAAQALADKMTEFAVSRCEHGSSNRCRLCGVERVRDFEMGLDGEQTWRVLWRPIGKTAAPDLKLLPGGVSPNSEAA